LNDIYYWILEQGKFFLVGIWEGNDYAIKNDVVNQPLIHYEKWSGITALMDPSAKVKYVTEHVLYWTAQCAYACNLWDYHRS
jgi:hypothetical protein